MLHHQNVQTTPTPLSMGTGSSFTGSTVARGVTLTFHLHPVPGFEWVDTDVPLLTPNAFVACQFTLSTFKSFTIYCIFCDRVIRPMSRTLSLPVRKTDTSRVRLEAALSKIFLYEPPVYSHFPVCASSIIVVWKPPVQTLVYPQYPVYLCF